MRSHIFMFSQMKVVKYNLKLSDLLILDYLNQFFESDKTQTVIHNEELYHWITYRKIKDDLPILNIDIKQIFNIISDLVEKGLIKKWKMLRDSTKVYLKLNLKDLYDDIDAYDTYVGEDTALARYSSSPESITPEIKINFTGFLYHNSVIKKEQIDNTVGLETFNNGVKIKLKQLLSDKVLTYFNKFRVEVENGSIKLHTVDVPVAILYDNMYKLERALVDTYIALLPKVAF